MSYATILAIMLLLLSGIGCNPDLESRLRTQEADIKQLKAEIAELKQKQKPGPEHHYELRNVGFRTFRFDSATGETCIQLTSSEDWKRKETKSQSCECMDASAHWAAMPLDTESQRQAAEFEYNFSVKRACGG